MKSTLPLLGYTNTGLPIHPITGSEGGYNTAGDVVVRNTIDGRPLSELWTEFNLALDLVNENRDIVTNLLCNRTTLSADEIAQTTDDPGFEVASEFGEPTAARPDFRIIKVGFPFRDFDRRTAYTWKFLRDANAAQVEQVHRAVIAADNKLTTTSVVARLLDPRQGENADGVPVYGLYNGDVMVPPRSGFKTFAAGHSHYLTTQSVDASGRDIDDMAKHITEHGYGLGTGVRLLLFVNPDDVGPITAARVGDDAGSLNDFIPASGGAPFLTSEAVVGAVPSGEYEGLEIAGQYGRVRIVPHEFMPPGYMLMVATDGPDGVLNPVGFREHVGPGWRGLRIVPGNQQGYPLQDAIYMRAFGVGVRHRGAAVAMQITTDEDYTPPPQFAGVLL